MAVRTLIFQTAAAQATIGPLIETLKWGQPAYLPATPRVGTTIRIDALRPPRTGYAIYVHCQTGLVEDFRARYGGLLTFEGNRAIVLEGDEAPPRDALRHCIAMALSYHLAARKRRAA